MVVEARDLWASKLNLADNSAKNNFSLDSFSLVRICNDLCKTAYSYDIEFEDFLVEIVTIIQRKPFRVQIPHFFYILLSKSPIVDMLDINLVAMISQEVVN